MCLDFSRQISCLEHRLHLGSCHCKGSLEHCWGTSRESLSLIFLLPVWPLQVPWWSCEYESKPHGFAEHICCVNSKPLASPECAVLKSLLQTFIKISCVSIQLVIKYTWTLKILGFRVSWWYTITKGSGHHDQPNHNGWVYTTLLTLDSS